MINTICFGDSLKVEVSDTGRGIAAEDLDAIFEPFYQTGDQRHYEGTGLGLPICRRLVRLMEGELQVESAPGKGSRFWFEIPLSIVQGDAPIPQRECDSRVTGFKGAAKKILIVDDTPVNRKVLADFLRPLGFEIHEAEDGLEAITQVTACRPDIIFMDLIMPNMDGFQTTRRLRALPDFTTPIFAISAGVFEEQKQAALAAGCNAFLVKPIELNRILDVLTEHCAIEWIESDAEGETTAAEIIAPPPEELQALLKLAHLGRITQIIDQLRVLIEDGPAEYLPYYQLALKLAMSFQIEKLIAFLKG